MTFKEWINAYDAIVAIYKDTPNTENTCTLVDVLRQVREFAYTTEMHMFDRMEALGTIDIGEYERLKEAETILPIYESMIPYEDEEETL